MSYCDTLTFLVVYLPRTLLTSRVRGTRTVVPRRVTKACTKLITINKSIKFLMTDHKPNIINVVVIIKRTES